MPNRLLLNSGFRHNDYSFHCVGCGQYYDLREVSPRNVYTAIRVASNGINKTARKVVKQAWCKHCLSIAAVRCDACSKIIDVGTIDVTRNASGKNICELCKNKIANKRKTINKKSKRILIAYDMSYKCPYCKKEYNSIDDGGESVRFRVDEAGQVVGKNLATDDADIDIIEDCAYMIVCPKCLAENTFICDMCSKRCGIRSYNPIKIKILNEDEDTGKQVATKTITVCDDCAKEQFGIENKSNNNNLIDNDDNDANVSVKTKRKKKA